MVQLERKQANHTIELTFLPMFIKAKRNILPHNRLHPYMQVEAGIIFYLPASASHKTVEGLYLSTLNKQAVFLPDYHFL